MSIGNNSGITGIIPSSVDGAGNSGSRIRIASNTGGWITVPVARSNGTDTSATNRIGFRVNTRCKAPRWVFAGGYQDSSGLLNPTGNAVRIFAVLDSFSQLPAIPLNNATGIPISLGGRTAHILPDGEIMESHALGVALEPATDYNYRVYTNVDTGGRWPHLVTTSSYVGYGANARTTSPTYGSTVTDGSDKTQSFADSGGGLAATAHGFGAIAVLAEQITHAAVCLVAGDSIAAGSGDVAGRGYIVRALESAGIGHLNVGIGGITAQNLWRFGQVPQYLSQYADHIMLHIGTNDFNAGATVAQIKSRILDLARTFTAAGAKIWVSTVLPRVVATTDAYASPGNQTPVAWEALRVEYNNYVRHPNGLRTDLRADLGSSKIGGIFDPCVIAERGATGELIVLDENGQQSVGSGGRWVTTGAANYATVDGIHPSPTLTALMAAAVPVAAITL